MAVYLELYAGPEIYRDYYMPFFVSYPKALGLIWVWG